MSKHLMLWVGLLVTLAMGIGAQRGQSPTKQAGFGNEAVTLSVCLYNDPTYTEVSAVSVKQQLRLAATASGIDPGETVWIQIFENGVEIASGSENPLIFEPHPTSGELFNGTHIFLAQATPQRGATSGPTTSSSTKPVDAIKVTGVSGTGATKVTATVGDANIVHFVTPKGAADSKVTLTVTINPDNAAAKQKITWEGATQDPNDPLKATVAKDQAAKHVVKVKVNGVVDSEMRVWVVWATGTATKNGGPTTVRGQVADQHVPQQVGPGAAIRSDWSFVFTISPLAMLTDADRPDFSGNKTVDPPGGAHLYSGGDLKNGATKKWDVSRRSRTRALVPTVQTVWFEKPGGTVYDNLPNANVVKEDYPADDVKGNDDRATGDENNVPDAQGKVTSVDTPTLPVVRDDGGAVGDTIEYRYQFGEFLRLEIAGTWVRVSDFVSWRHHAKLIKKDEAVDNVDHNADGDKVDKLWVDNGSVTDTTNDGW